MQNATEYRPCFASVSIVLYHQQKTQISCLRRTLEITAGCFHESLRTTPAETQNEHLFILT